MTEERKDTETEIAEVIEWWETTGRERKDLFLYDSTGKFICTPWQLSRMIELIGEHRRTCRRLATEKLIRLDRTFTTPQKWLKHLRKRGIDEPRLGALRFIDEFIVTKLGWARYEKRGGGIKCLIWERDPQEMRQYLGNDPDVLRPMPLLAEPTMRQITKVVPAMPTAKATSIVAVVQPTAAVVSSASNTNGDDEPKPAADDDVISPDDMGDMIVHLEGCLDDLETGVPKADIIETLADIAAYEKEQEAFDALEAHGMFRIVEGSAGKLLTLSEAALALLRLDEEPESETDAPVPPELALPPPKEGETEGDLLQALALISEMQAKERSLDVSEVLDELNEKFGADRARAIMCELKDRLLVLTVGPSAVTVSGKGLQALESGTEPKPVDDEPKPVDDEPKPVDDEPKPVDDEPKPAGDEAPPKTYRLEGISDADLKLFKEELDGMISADTRSIEELQERIDGFRLKQEEVTAELSRRRSARLERGRVALNALEEEERDQLIQEYTKD